MLRSNHNQSILRAKLVACFMQVCYHWGRGAAAAGGGVAGVRAAGGRPVPGYHYQQHPWLRTAL